MYMPYTDTYTLSVRTWGHTRDKLSRRADETHDQPLDMGAPSALAPKKEIASKKEGNEEVQLGQEEEEEEEEEGREEGEGEREGEGNSNVSRYSVLQSVAIFDRSSKGVLVLQSASPVNESCHISRVNHVTCHL